MFFRNWVPFVVAVVGVTAVVAASLLLRNASYTASAYIRVNSDSEVTRTMGFERQTWLMPADQNTAHFNDLMQNTLPGGFVDGALKKANLRYPINVDPQAKDPRFLKLRKSVSAARQSGDVFSISMNWDDKEECEQIVQALQRAYIEEAGLARMSQAEATKTFLDFEIKRFKAMLQNAERALVNYKTSHSGQLPEAQEASLELFANLSMERDYLAITAQDNALKTAALAQRIAQIKPTAILEQTYGSDPLVQQLRELEAKRSAIVIEGWKPDSTLVREKDQQIEGLKRKIASQQKVDPTQQRNITETKLQDNPEYMHLTQQLTEARIAEKTQKAQMALLNQKIKDYQTRIAELPKAERELTEKTRDYTLLQTQYNDLLTRRHQAELKANVDGLIGELMLQPQNAIYAENSLGRTKKIVMMAGSLLVGLVIGLGIILFREWMDPSIRYENDAERLLGVPILAGLPESSHLRFPASNARKISFMGRPQLPPSS